MNDKILTIILDEHYKTQVFDKQGKKTRISV